MNTEEKTKKVHRANGKSVSQFRMNSPQNTVFSQISKTSVAQLIEPEKEKTRETWW